MIEFRQKLDSSKVTAANKNAMKRYWLVLLLLSLFFILIGVAIILLDQGEGDIGRGIFAIVLGVLFAPLMYLILYFNQKSYSKSAALISSETEEVYTFDEQYMTVTQTKNDEFYSTAKAKYTCIHKAYEDNKYFYLYTSKMQLLVIDKSAITQGTVQELTSMLRCQLGAKFKYKK